MLDESYIRAERRRQENTLTLIASENYASQDVLDAQGSTFTNQYAEGTPGSRYYAGCDMCDAVENTAISRATELFGAGHANVQPHSGSQANQAVYLTALEPGDTILSLKLDNGGHLSHGSPVNFSGKVYDVEQYGVAEDGRLDYSRIDAQARTVDPDAIVSGFSAYPREVDFEAMQEIANAVNAVHIADIAHITGLVATGHHQNPVGTADYVTGSTHKTIRAGRGGMILCDEEKAEDVDKAVFPGVQGGPLMHNIAGKAVGFGEALEPSFKKYIDQVCENAQVLAETLQDEGFHPVTGGTDNHIVLLDFQETHPDLTGQKAEERLTEVGIIANKNTVPGDERSPFVTSGLRLGTAAITTRGFDENATEKLALSIAAVLNGEKDGVEQAVSEMTKEYPIYD